MNRLLAFLLCVSAAVAQAQDFPGHAPKILVPFPPGGAADTFARLAGQKLGDLWGKQAVIEKQRIALLRADRVDFYKY